jgi:hypothetical protein
MNINLHIERLVLDGINIRPDQRHLLKASMEAELGRLLSKGAVSRELASGGAMPAISAKGFQLSASNGPGNSPAQLGRQIAHSVYGGIGK